MLSGRLRFLGSLTAITAGLAALAVGAATAADTHVSIAQATAPVTLHVGGTPNDDMTPVVYAKNTGMFQKAGLDVVIEKSTSGSAVASAVAAGAYDIGKSSIASIFDAHKKGIPFTIVAPASLYDSKAPYAGMLLPKDSPIKSGKDTAGLTFGVASLGSIGRVAMAAWIDQHSGDATSAKFVEVPFSTVAPALEQKRIAAGEIGQPTMAEDLGTGRFRFLPAYDAIAPQFYVAVFYTTKDFSSKHPEALKTFVRVLTEAAKYTNTHPAATAKMMSEYSGVPFDVYQKLPRVAAGTEIVLSQIQPVIDAAVKYGTLKGGFPARELIDANVSAR